MGDVELLEPVREAVCIACGIASGCIEVEAEVAEAEVVVGQEHRPRRRRRGLVEGPELVVGVEHLAAGGTGGRTNVIPGGEAAGDRPDLVEGVRRHAGGVSERQCSTAPPDGGYHGVNTSFEVLQTPLAKGVHQMDSSTRLLVAKLLVGLSEAIDLRALHSPKC